jgi:hypothetical protein
VDDALLLLIFSRFTAHLVSQVRDHRMWITYQSQSTAEIQFYVFDGWYGVQCVIDLEIFFYSPCFNPLG